MIDVKLQLCPICKTKAATEGQPGPVWCPNPNRNHNITAANPKQWNALSYRVNSSGEKR